MQHVSCLCSLPPTQVPGPGAGMTPAASTSHLPPAQHWDWLHCTNHPPPLPAGPRSPVQYDAWVTQPPVIRGSSEPGTFGTVFTIPHVDSVDSELRWCGQWTMQCGLWTSLHARMDVKYHHKTGAQHPTLGMLLVVGHQRGSSLLLTLAKCWCWW